MPSSVAIEFEDVVEAEPLAAPPMQTGRDWRRMLRTGLVGFIAFLLIGNGLIMASMAWFRLTTDPGPDHGVTIDNFRQIDDRVFRGAAPGADDYHDLALLDVTMVVDLRAEADPIETERAAAAGLDRIHLPVRDGQLPSSDQVATFLAAVDDADGKVFLHCGAGVGRTGAMSAWYLNTTGQAEGGEALRRNLAVGPPSLEQIVFSVRTGDGEYRRPSAPVTAVSRVLDGPRRIWHNIF